MNNNKTGFHWAKDERGTECIFDMLAMMFQILKKQCALNNM
jgi:hypothetical protein